MKILKLNTLLAITDHTASLFRKGVEDYVKFFKSNQSAFKGEKKTYDAKPGTIDDPTKRGNKLVVTTVTEKLAWLEKESAEYIDALFMQEKTNASGTAKANLIVDGVNWGEYTSLELLRLKVLLESGTFKEMYENIPVRNDDEVWKKTTSIEDYAADREIFESQLLSGTNRTTEKETYILEDPNIAKIDGAKYTPQTASRNTVIELGTMSHQKFSGEYSHLQRAEILARRSKLLTAVLEAMKRANDIDAIASAMTATRLFAYLHKGENK